MTVPVGNGRSTVWAADGSNRTWAFPFKVLRSDHISLKVTSPTGAVSTVTGPFDIMGLGDSAGGSVIYPIAPVPALASGAKVQVIRRVPLEQPNRIGNQGGFHAQTHEDTFDLLEMQVQQNQEDILRTAEEAKAYTDSRSVVVPAGQAEYSSLTLARSATIPASVSFLRTAGYALPGDGGAALLKVVSSEPAHAGKWAAQGGKWLELVEPEPNAAMFGAVPGTNAQPAIQAMMDYLEARGGGTGRIPAGDYTLDPHITPRNRVNLRGAGTERTILRKVVSGHAIGKYSTTYVTDVEISDLTLDMGGLSIDTAGIVIEYVERFAIRRCRLLNCPYWGIQIGVTAGATDTQYRNNQVTIEDCYFNNFFRTYEQILLFNCADVLIRNCQFANTIAIGIGIYQHTDRVTVRDCKFLNCNQGIYYSVTCHNTLIAGCTFRGGLAAIQGGNESDHGLMGEDRVKGLTVTDCYFTTMSSGLQLGAVHNAIVKGCTFEFVKENALVIDDGNLANLTGADSAFLTISDCIFRSNNTSDTSHALHPGILVSGAANYLTISGCHFYDDKTVKTQWTAIGFLYQPSAVVTIVGCLLTSYNSGGSVTLGAGATMTNGRLYGCSSVSTLPAGFNSY